MPDVSHKEALQLIEDDWRADEDNRDDAMDDLRFVAGDQWDEDERQKREMAGRPCLRFNQMGKFVNQVAGDIRQAQPGVQVFPVDSQDDVPLAQVFEGLIRQIEYQSGATAAYAHGAESAVRCGIGHWRFETEFTQDSVFEQDIKIKRILDPLSVVWDSGSVEIDRSDARHCWVTEWVHKRAFKERFKDRNGVDVELNNNHGTLGGLYWKRSDFIRIAEYWHLKPTIRNLVLLNSGEVLDVTEVDDEGLQRLRASGRVARARKVDGFEVKRRLMDGADWLDEEEDWAGRFIPIVPCIGAEIAYDGRIIRHGLIRFAKDPQKLYNIWRSAGAEVIAKSPKAPWLVTPDQIKSFEAYWNVANRSNLPYLPFNVDPKAPTLMPQRQDPPTAPAALWQEAGLAADDMKNCTGIFDAGLGAASNEKSGRAILARQRESDVGSFLYTDNFKHAMRRTGQILVDLIPKIYDTERTVRVLDIEGNETFVPINVETVAMDGEPIIINNMAHGRFDVRPKLGAPATTARIEAAEQMSQAMQTNPTLWGIIGDLFFKNSDFPGAEEIAERMKKTIPPDILGEDEENPPPPPSEQEVQAQQLALAEMAAQIEDMQATIDKKRAETQKIEAQTEQIIEDVAAL